jgi:hypothetical protein
MNRSYRSIWNEAVGAWVAASEISSARGKPNKSAVAKIIAVAVLTASAGINVAHAQFQGGGGTATGPDQVAIGPNAFASAELGLPTATSKSSNIAIGQNATASGVGASTIAIGGQAYATNPTAGLGDALAIGTQATASGQDSTAIGGQTTASGMNTLAIGNNGTSALATNATAFGVGATASAGYATAVGSFATVSGAGATAIGANATAPALAQGQNSIAIGGQSVTAATALGGVAIGGAATTSAAGGVALGQSATASGANSVALGPSSIASYASSVAIGYGSATGVAAPTGTGYLTGSAAPLSEVSVGSPTALRRITNVADGSAPQDAVTVSQLSTGMSTTASSVSRLSTSTSTGLSTATSSIASLSTSASTGISTAQSGVTSLSTGLNTSNSNVTSLSTGIANGTMGLVQQIGGAPGNGAITVGASTGGTSVNFTGTAGARQLSGVAAGVAPTDAANVSQLQAVSAVASDAVLYDSATHTSVTLGGVGAASAVALTNVAAGAISSTSTDAVNGSQLFALETRLGTIDGNLTQLTSTAQTTSRTTNNPAASNSKYVAVNTTGGAASATGTESVAIGGNATANSGNSIALGSGSQASGSGSSAVGANAVASAPNSVAIGYGSIASEANSVSVGSPGNERTITNLAPGVNPTDAVNMGQLESVQDGVNSVARRAYSGVAAATALTMIPEVDLGKTIAIGVGTANYQGYSSVAIGLTARITQNLKVKAGVGTSSSGTVYGAGLGYQW